MTPPATLVGRRADVTPHPNAGPAERPSAAEGRRLIWCCEFSRRRHLGADDGLGGAALATTAAQIVALIALLQDAAKGEFLPSSPKQWARSAGAPFRQIFTKGAPVVAALSAKTAVLLSLSYAAASTAYKKRRPRGLSGPPDPCRLVLRLRAGWRRAVADRADVSASLHRRGSIG